MFHRCRLWSVGIWAVVVLGGCLVACGEDRRPDVHFVPTPPEVVAEMLKAANVGRDDIVYDLGCGDGRIVITAIGKYGARKGTGIDIDPARIKECNENALKANLTDRVTFLEQDLYETDFSEATVVALYLLPTLNVRLRPMLFRQLRPGDRIVSHAFDMAEWQADKTMRVPGPYGERTAYYWMLPAGVAGTWRVAIAGAQGEQAGQLLLRQRFQVVSGTLKVDGQQQAIADAALAGDRLTFSTVREAQGEKSKTVFSGRILGNTLRGTAETQGGAAAGKRDWSAQRDRVNLVGTWQWTRGEKKVALDIRRYDGRFHATVADGGAPTPVAQFYVWGAGVYFVLDGRDGPTYEGVAEGDRIAGTVSIERGAGQDWTAQRAPQSP